MSAALVSAAKVMCCIQCSLVVVVVVVAATSSSAAVVCLLTHFSVCVFQRPTQTRQPTLAKVGVPASVL